MQATARNRMQPESSDGEESVIGDELVISDGTDSDEELIEKLAEANQES